MREGLYVEREEDCLSEYMTYVETDNGGYEAMKGCHDDRLMTRAIGMPVCMHEMDIPRIVERTAGCGGAGRRKQRVVSAATMG